jgi:hypothetical protein
MDNMSGTTKKRGSSPPLTEEAAINKGIAAARKLSLKQLEAGTATAQIQLHYLELGTLRESIKLEKLKQETRLLEAKIESEKAQTSTKEIVEAALKALKTYTVQPYDENI